jgi:hypothetical protein
VLFDVYGNGKDLDGPSTQPRLNSLNYTRARGERDLRAASRMAGGMILLHVS